MSGDYVFNGAKGQVKYLASLPTAGNALIVVLLKAAGLEADATLKDYTTLSALLAGTSDELTDASYSRKAITSSITATVDNTNDLLDVDMPDQTWSALAGAAVGKALVCYRPASGSADSAITPLTMHDFVVTPDGSAVTLQLSPSGFYRATD